METTNFIMNAFHFIGARQNGFHSAPVMSCIDHESSKILKHVYGSLSYLCFDFLFSLLK